MEPQDTLDPTLLLRYLEAPHQLTADEQAQMEQWLRRDAQHPEELDRIRQLWEQSAQARPPTDVGYRCRLAACLGADAKHVGERKSI